MARAAAADHGAHALPDVRGIDLGADRPRLAAPAGEPAARFDLRLLRRPRPRGDAPALRMGAGDRRGDRAAVPEDDRRPRPGRSDGHDHGLQPGAAAGDALRQHDGAVERRAPGDGGAGSGGPGDRRFEDR